MAADAEHERIGDLRLVRGEAPTPRRGVVDLDLNPAGGAVDGWLAAGARLALQALAPAAALPERQRAGMSFLGVGPGAALPAFAALRLGAESSRVVLHPDDQEAFDALARTADSRRAKSFRRVDEVPDGAYHDMAAYGCDGAVPALEDCAPLVRRLRPEGQLLVYGFPADSLYRLFDGLAQRGLSLRAMGIHGGLAFLSGSLEHNGFR